MVNNRFKIVFRCSFCALSKQGGSYHGSAWSQSWSLREDGDTV